MKKPIKKNHLVKVVGGGATQVGGGGGVQAMDPRDSLLAIINLSDNAKERIPFLQ